MSDTTTTDSPAVETETVEVETQEGTTEVEVPAEETPETPAEETPEVTEPAKPAKPPVLDSKEQALELGMRVKLLGEKDRDDEGKQRFGTITGLEYQRQRAVIKVDDVEKLAVRPANKLMIKKTKSGKIERVERAVRGAKAKVAEAVQDAPEATPADA